MAPLLPKKSILPLLALILAGLAGNYFGYSIFFSVEVLFGSIFALLALQLFGRGPGLLAAIVISSMTFFRMHHPYLMIVMAAEVVVVDWLYRRKGLGLVFADTLYWLGLGMPLVYLFYRGVMQIYPDHILIPLLKQAINGISNALFARLIFMAISVRSREILFPLREVVFNLLAFFMFIPALTLIAHEGQEEYEETELGIRQRLIQVNSYTADSLEAWLGQKSSRIVHLAWLAATSFPDIQHDLDYLRTLDTDLFAVGIIDKNARSTAFSPAIDEEGQSTVGKDFSDRPYLPELKRTLQPQLSEVVVSKIGKSEPIAVLLAPIVAKGAYQGYAAGILKLQRVEEIIALHGLADGLRCTLVDRHNRVIATNRDDLTVMAPFSRGQGEMRQLDSGISQWTPALPANLASQESWQRSTYVIEQTIGRLAEWRLIVEQLVAPFQQEFYALYADQLELIFVILLLMIVFAEIISRTTLISVESLQRISSALPGKLTSIDGIIWPRSKIREVDALIGNFREMAGVLVQKFTETRQLNLTLEQRVDERTRALQESEAKYRIIFENKMYAVYIFDLETLRLLDANDAFLKLYGYGRDELLAGMTVREINAWAEEADSAIQEAMRQGSIFLPLCYHRKKDGSIFPVEIAGGPYLWQGRRVMFAIAHDITERKKATETLIERTVQLEDLTRNLEARIEEEVGRRRKHEQILLQQGKLAAMGEMLGAVAHQWRQPLNTLGLCIQNIKDSYRHGVLSQGYLDTTVHESMTQINYMSRTIDDFRNFFKPDKDKAPFDTMLAVGEVLTLFSAQLEANDISFALTCLTHRRTFDKVADIVVCPAKIAVGYKNEFEHVILNLVNNAKDAIIERREQGRFAEGESGHIVFEFQNSSGMIVITVRDNGGGIPVEVIDRIFEPYFTTKDPAKGTGIGLYLSKVIIEDHMHGKLSVRHVEDGASFVIVVPGTEGEANGDH